MVRKTGEILIKIIKKNERITDTYILQTSFYLFLAFLLFALATILIYIPASPNDRKTVIIGLVFSLVLGGISVVIRALDVAFEAARLDIEKMESQSTPITDSTELNLQANKDKES